MAKPAEVERKWYVVDATDMVLGRLASQVAMVLRGKNKPTFTPNVDTGDYVIIINADKVRLTGKKLEKKYYRYHTGYIGGQRGSIQKTYGRKTRIRRIQSRQGYASQKRYRPYDD